MALILVLYEFTRSKKGMLHLIYENNIYRPSGKARHSSPSENLRETQRQGETFESQRKVESSLLGMREESKNRMQVKVAIT
ncbi:hypothetical protein QE152_g23313 [Popillia japonica]|uniref:Uncharacterized protein n=1 Tax=Popillia japonica TaxID=7064 RepID=A0AAW1KIC9_POPJA